MEIHTKEVHTSNVLLAVLFVVAGIVLLVWPLEAMTICCQFIGSIVIFYGITRFYMYYKQYHEGSYQVTLNLVIGLLTTAVGLYVFFKAEEVIKLFPYLTGLTLLLQAIIKFQQALEIKRVGFDQWKVIIGFALINILAGVLLLFNPFEAIELTLRIIAVLLLYEGISECWSLYHLSVAVKVIDRYHKQVEHLSEHDLIDLED